MHEEIQSELAKRGVVAVLIIDDTKQAVPVAKALIKGGITAIELALRTEAAPSAIKRIHENVPEMMLGIGTVIQNNQVKMVKDLGASFAVSPGCNPRILQEAKACNLPFAPGISTATDLELAYENGCDFLKLFPAVPLGGISYFKAMTGPYGYLGIKFFPLGGISEQTLGEWASQKNVPCVGGSWIAPPDLIKERNYEEITRRAEKAITIWNDTKRGLK